MPDEKPVPEEQPEPDETPAPKPAGSSRFDVFAQAMRRPSRAQAVVGVLLAVVGFAAITQVRSREQDDTYAGQRQEDLIQVLNGLAGTSQRAEDDIAQLEETRDDLQTSTNRRQTALEQARKEAETLRILAGTVPTTGPGIRIRIEDPTGQVQARTLLDAIQELRVAGAEAMEFNDKVRVVAQTSLEDVAGGVRVDGELVEAPYIIDVIGEPHTLSGALTFPQGPKFQVAERDGTLTSDERDKLVIESVRDEERPDFAEPDDDQ